MLINGMYWYYTFQLAALFGSVVMMENLQSGSTKTVFRWDAVFKL